jgi:hypothetical protein
MLTHAEKSALRARTYAVPCMSMAMAAIVNSVLPFVLMARGTQARSGLVAENYDLLFRPDMPLMHQGPVWVHRVHTSA